MSRFAISFDDGLLDQFKWARGLWRCGVRGTFYVNPFYVGFRMGRFLSLEQLRKMHDEWGHTIANHFWLHEAPKINGGTRKEILLRNLTMGAEWLERNGFEDGARLVALPYGSEGGGWTKEHIEEIFLRCDEVRDVGSGINEPGSRLITARETTERIEAPSNSLVCYYFHDNRNTKDRELIELIEGLRSEYVQA